MADVLLASAYVHRIDPVILPIYGDFALRWYGLSYAVGFVIAWALILLLVRTGRSTIPLKAVGDLMFYVIIGVLVGGRLGYAVFYDPALLVGFSGDPPFWHVLAINKGGMASHGGMIGVILACILFARRHKVSALHVLDIGALACTPGLMLGRVANFLNGELWGRPLPEAMQQSPPWWSIKYPKEIHRWPLEKLAELQPVVGEVGISRAEWNYALTQLAAGGEVAKREAGLLVARTANLMIDAIRGGNELLIEAVRPLLTAYYPSQLLQALSDGPILFAILALVWLRARKPGVVGSVFLIAYGALRIVTEMFRQPDEGVALLLGLSRGQVLSALMIAIGTITLWWCARRHALPQGGLLTPAAAPQAARAGKTG